MSSVAGFSFLFFLLLSSCVLEIVAEEQQQLLVGVGKTHLNHGRLAHFVSIVPCIKEELLEDLYSLGRNWASRAWTGTIFVLVSYLYLFPVPEVNSWHNG